MIVAAIFIVTVLLTFLIKKIALRHAIIDTPNARSSHTVPTPRGGGLAIIIAFFIGVSYLFFINEIEQSLYFALLSVWPIVLISLVDDISPQSARKRVAVQLFSSLLAIYFLGGIQTWNFGVFVLEGIWLNFLALLLLLWFTNLYNFLDGIDGYAGSEAVFIGLAAYWLFGNLPVLYLAVAAGGFLVFNWHKASIFMGDVGSASLGFIFAVFMLNDAHAAVFSGWFVLLSLFWFDATATLFRRWMRKENLAQAHRNHAYQRLNQSGIPHDRVVMLGMGINVLFAFMLSRIDATDYWLVLIFVMIILSVILRVVDARKAFE
ncbi:MAG: glycosyl transferase [Epsilonproteobacteria bacterium]|nr:MAG: glycosyl transferase [Campylobacterota bacterium]